MYLCLTCGERESAARHHEDGRRDHHPFVNDYGAPVPEDAGRESEPHDEDLRVACAAIRVGDLTYSLPRPARHGDIISELYFYHQAWWQGARGESRAVQGFLLSNGVFANRKVAGRQAIISGEIKKLEHPPELYSEDLW